MNEGKFVERPANSDTESRAHVCARARSHVRLFSGDGSRPLPVPSNLRPRARGQVSSSTVTTVSCRDCLLPEVGAGSTAARLTAWRPNGVNG